MVSRLQTALNDGRGDFAPDTNPVLAVDGIFGPITASSVRGTQEFNNALVDGIVWIQTWAIPIHAAGQVIADLVRGTWTRLNQSNAAVIARFTPSMVV